MSGLAALLLLTQSVAASVPPAGPQSAIDAERAFAEDARATGQWTAFRKWADGDAILFTPQPTPLAKALDGLDDPADSVRWWPAASWQSCDRRAAVNRGVAHWPDGSGGWFATVWQQAGEGAPWRFVLDHGERAPAQAPRPATVDERRASCAGTPPMLSRGFAKGEGGGASADRTLRWHWRVASDGERWVTAELWDGARYRTVLTDHVTPPRRAPAKDERPAG